jgi:hypothetical protein
VLKFLFSFYNKRIEAIVIPYILDSTSLISNLPLSIKKSYINSFIKPIHNIQKIAVSILSVNLKIIITPKKLNIKCKSLSIVLIVFYGADAESVRTIVEVREGIAANEEQAPGADATNGT